MYCIIGLQFLSIVSHVIAGPTFDAFGPTWRMRLCLSLDIDIRVISMFYYSLCTTCWLYFQGSLAKETLFLMLISNSRGQPTPYWVWTLQRPGQSNTPTLVRYPHRPERPSNPLPHPFSFSSPKIRKPWPDWRLFFRQPGDVRLATRLIRRSIRSSALIPVAVAFNTIYVCV